MNKEKKETIHYSLQDKEEILQKLDIERREEKKKQEKNEILDKLDCERREKQKEKERHKDKHGNKKVYTLESKDFYKILNLGRDYFIKVDDCNHQSSRPKMLSIYHRGFDGLQKTKVLVKFKDDTDKIYISEDALRVYFKATSLEEEK